MGGLDGIREKDESADTHEQLKRMFV